MEQSFVNVVAIHYEKLESFSYIGNYLLTSKDKNNDIKNILYFDSKFWYTGTTVPENYNESELSEVEAANKDLIVEYEKEQGYR